MEKLKLPVSRSEGLVQSAARKGVDFRESFEHFDTNRDGEIDEREFQRGMEKLKLPVARSEARQLMEKFAGRSTSYIKYRDFVRALSDDNDEDELATKVQRILRRRDDAPGEMDRLFRDFDTNRDGEISEREFLRAMDKLRLDLTDREARKLMRRFDRNNG